MVKNKHLTDFEREKIEECLRESIPLKRIATHIGRSASTVSREIRAHAIESDKYPPYRIRNRCVKREDCQIRYLCSDKPNCTKRCSTCKLCNEVCKDFKEQLCYKLCDPPYVCYTEEKTIPKFPKNPAIPVGSVILFRYSFY